MSETTVGSSLNVKAYRMTRYALMQGRFRPGERLKLRELASAYEMSVTPVREALMQLASEFALCQLDRRSFHVPVYSVKEFEEISELRVMLEGLAIVKSVPKVTPQDIEKLRAIDHAMDAARREDRWGDVNIENELFHMSAYRLAECPALLQLIESLWLRFGPVANGIRGIKKIDVLLRGHDNLPHKQLLRALETRDADLAKAAIEKDITTATERFLPYLRDFSDLTDRAAEA